MRRVARGGPECVVATTAREPAVSDRIRIGCFSRSTFPRPPAERAIELNVARTLVQSRIDGARRVLLGTLPSPTAAASYAWKGVLAMSDAFMPRSCATRGMPISRCCCDPIERTGFAVWSMKYVPLDVAMKGLLRERGLAAFDPYRFDDATVRRVLEGVAAAPRRPCLPARRCGRRTRCLHGR